MLLGAHREKQILGIQFLVLLGMFGSGQDCVGIVFL